MKSIASLALALCVVAGSTRAQVGIETRPRRRSLRSGLTPGRSLALVRSFYGRLTRATFRQRRSRRLTLPRWRPRASTSPVGVELTCARSSRVALARSLALRATHFARSLVRSFARSLVVPGDQSYESCDACLGSFLGDFVLPLYPSLGLDIATFPKSPSQLAAELTTGNDSGLGAIQQDGPCGEYFTESSSAAGADLQTYAFSIIGWVLNSTDVHSLFARPGSLTRATRFARSPGATLGCHGGLRSWPPCRGSIRSSCLTRPNSSVQIQVFNTVIVQ